MSTAEVEESALARALREIAAPLVALDGGTVRIVLESEHLVVLALEGACLACPARNITRMELLLPLVHAVVGRPINVELA